MKWIKQIAFCFTPKNKLYGLPTFIIATRLFKLNNIISYKISLMKTKNAKNTNNERAYKK